MKHVAPSAPRRDVFDRLALRLREVVREEHVNSLSGVERYTVRSTSPLTFEHLDGDLVLTDGDPDFMVGAWVRQYHANYGLVAGDQVLVARHHDQTWHAVDVADPGGQIGVSFVGHTHSDPQGGTVGPGTLR